MCGKKRLTETQIRNEMSDLICGRREERDMVNLSEEELRQLQLVELEILVEVDRICRKNNINYNITGGTLLGAVRHNGFIPWDDDADVALLRKDYERFKQACKIDLDTSRFYYQDAWETEGYRWSYGKVRRKETLYLRENQDHMPYEQGISVDIFPIDDIPENYIMRFIDNVHCFLIRKFFWSEVGRIDEKNKIKKKIYKLMSRISRERILEHYSRLITKRTKENSSKVRVALMPLSIKKGFGHQKKWYSESAEYEFEGHKLYGVRDYDDFLKYVYGDYMKLPPIEKRKYHPASKVILLKNNRG